MTLDITEEDVLAIHLLWWLSCQGPAGLAVPGAWGVGSPTLAWDVARSRGLGFGSLAAIADTERRLEVEKCELKVLEAAEDSVDGGRRTNLGVRLATLALQAAREAL